MRPCHIVYIFRSSAFQFTHPGKGATSISLSQVLFNLSFNSRTLGRVRLTSTAIVTATLEFQFTHPGKGATQTHPSPYQFNEVSIHAPWEGCDSLSYPPARSPRVSIHAPWEGCDPLFRSRLARSSPFQFTHPGKGATQISELIQAITSFNSRTLGRVRLPPGGRPRLLWTVSIHAPWEGCDQPTQ